MHPHTHTRRSLNTKIEQIVDCIMDRASCRCRRRCRCRMTWAIRKFHKMFWIGGGARDNDNWVARVIHFLLVGFFYSHSSAGRVCNVCTVYLIGNKVQSSARCKLNSCENGMGKLFRFLYAFAHNSNWKFMGSRNGKRCRRIHSLSQCYFNFWTELVSGLCPFWLVAGNKNNENTYAQCSNRYLISVFFFLLSMTFVWVWLG